MKEKPASKRRPVSAFDLFSPSYQRVMKNLPLFVLLSIPSLLGALNAMKADRWGYNDPSRFTEFRGFTSLSGFPMYGLIGLVGISIVFVVFFFVLSIIVRAMTYALELEAAQGKQPSLGHLWEVGKKYWLRLLGLIFVVGVLTLGGLLLFIVPGLIMIRRYFLAPYFMVDKDLSVSEAMKISAETTKPYSGAVWGVIGIMILLALSGTIPVVGPLLSLVLGVLYSVAPALRYEELKNFDRS